MGLRAFINNTNVEHNCALAAGLCVGGLNCLVSGLEPDHSFELWHCVRSVLLSVASYTAVALFIRWRWRGLLKRIVPVWVAIAILGTALLISLVGVYVGINSWRSPQRVERSLGEFIAVQVNDFLSLFIVVCVLTLPVTAMVYYARNMITCVWPKKVEPPPSILPNQ